MPTSLIGRLILFDLLKITTLAVIALSVLFVTGGAMVEADKLGLDPMRVLTMVPLLIPPMLPYTLPVSLLFACTFVYSRLSSNQEIVALKAGGIHVLRVLAPSFLLGILLSLAGVYLNDRVIPTCQQLMNRMIMANLETNIYAYLRTRGSISRPDFPYEIYVKDVNDDRLIQATFKHRAPSGQYDFIAQAEEATLAVVKPETATDSTEPMVNIRLLNHVVLSKEGRGRFQDQTYQMPLPTEFARRELKSEALDSKLCLVKSKEHEEQAKFADFDLSLTGAWGALQGDPVSFSEMIALNRVYEDRQARKAREMLGEVHGRWSQSFAALTFVLLGGPIGILFQRRDFLQTFFVCFLPIIIVYYPAMILAQNFVKEDILPVAISMWAPTILLCLGSFPILRQVIRY